MITTELLKQAVETAHDPCEADCLHAKAFGVESKDIRTEIVKEVMDLEATRQGTSGQRSVPALVDAAIFEGVHIGYRLHQLENTEPATAATAINENLPIVEMMEGLAEKLAIYRAGNSLLSKTVESLRDLRSKGMSDIVQYDDLLTIAKSAELGMQAGVDVCRYLQAITKQTQSKEKAGREQEKGDVTQDNYNGAQTFSPEPTPADLRKIVERYEGQDFTFPGDDGLSHLPRATRPGEFAVQVDVLPDGTLIFPEGTPVEVQEATRRVINANGNLQRLQHAPVGAVVSGAGLKAELGAARRIPLHDIGQAQEEVEPTGTEPFVK